MASHSSNYSANGRSENINLGSESETYNRVHHDLDSAAANRKPIVTESKYKVNVAEPGVDDLHLGQHHHESTGSKSTGTGAPKTTTTGSSTKTTTTSTTKNSTTGSKSSGTGPTGGTPGSKNTFSSNQQKGQFIAKPDVYSDDEGADDDEGGFPWVPVLGGAAAIAGVVAGLFYYKKQNPEVDQQFRRSVEDADHRVKDALGSGERRVKGLIGSGQQKLKELVGRGGNHVDVDDDGHSHDSNPGQGRGHSLNPFNSSGGDGDLYKVKQGDNLSKIAKKSGKKSWHEVAEENPSIRNPNLIYPGDRIRL